MTPVCLQQILTTTTESLEADMAPKLGTRSQVSHPGAGLQIQIHLRSILVNNLVGRLVAALPGYQEKPDLKINMDF